MPQLTKCFPVSCFVASVLWAGTALAGEIDFGKLKEKPDPFKNLPGVTVQEPVSNFAPQKYNCNSYPGFTRDSSSHLRKPVEIVRCTQGDLTVETTRDLEN